MEGPSTELIAILGALVLGATFKAVDAALVALGEVRLKALVDSDGVHAGTARRALRDMDRIHSRFLVGRVVCLTAGAALAAHVAQPYDGVMGAVLAAATVAVVYSLLAKMGETVARQRAGQWALWMLKWLRPLELIVLPLAAPLAGIGRVLERRVPEIPADDPERIAELGLERMIEESEEDGGIAEEHARLLRSVLEFKNTVAHEVMVPRTQMVAFEEGTPLPEVMGTIVDEGHSRYPVFRERVDQVVGVLYAKDLFSLLRRGELDQTKLAHVIRKPAFFSAETQKIRSLLREMQARHVHLAIVVDEFGGTSGIVTLEDILEEIVGDIRDEYDEDETSVLEISPGRYLVDAGLSIYDLQDRLGVELQDRGGDYDSVGGMVVDLAGHVPTVGESVETAGFRVIVREADQRHVRRVELQQRREAAAE